LLVFPIQAPSSFLCDVRINDDPAKVWSVTQSSFTNRKSRQADNSLKPVVYTYKHLLSLTLAI
jgi:hypothetical protein